MNILIIAVNYNSYDELTRYLQSLDMSARSCEKCHVSVAISDNSDINCQYEFPTVECLELRYVKNDNLGYFGGVSAIYNKCKDIGEFDYVIISNVDIVVPTDFFTKLMQHQNMPDEAWIANRIWSIAEKRDRNPKILDRCSKTKLKIQRTLYKYPFLDFIYTNTLYRRKGIQEEAPAREIYAGHGSFIILTKAFTNHFASIDYPIFLFGEEIFLAELIRNAKLRVTYDPTIVVNDIEHTSTGKMKKKSYYKYNLESIEYILNTFYE